VARGPHVARRSVFSGPWKHSEKIFKSKISSNLVLKLTCQKPSIYTRRYGAPLNMDFQKWPPSKINCSPLQYAKGPLNSRVIGPFLAWFKGPFRRPFCITCHNKKVYSISSQPLAVLKLFPWAYHICKHLSKKAVCHLNKQKNAVTKILLSSFTIRISPQKLI